MMSNLSPPPPALAEPTSPLDHQGGLSLWLRGGIFALVLVVAARPDRWAWHLPSLHAVFLGLFAYSILGELAACVLAILAPIALFAAVAMLLCFDRLVYVPTYRLARGRFRLSALAAFTVAVCVEGAIAGGVIMAVRKNPPVAQTSGNVRRASGTVVPFRPEGQRQIK